MEKGHTLKFFKHCLISSHLFHVPSPMSVLRHDPRPRLDPWSQSIFHVPMNPKMRAMIAEGLVSLWCPWPCCILWHCQWMPVVFVPKKPWTEAWQLWPCWRMYSKHRVKETTANFNMTNLCYVWTSTSKMPKLNWRSSLVSLISVHPYLPSFGSILSPFAKLVCSNIPAPCQRCPMVIAFQTGYGSKDLESICSLQQFWGQVSGNAFCTIPNTSSGFIQCSPVDRMMLSESQPWRGGKHGAPWSGFQLEPLNWPGIFKVLRKPMRCWVFFLPVVGQNSDTWMVWCRKIALIWRSHFLQIYTHAIYLNHLIYPWWNSEQH